jgi:putative phosphoesterase
MRSTIKFFMTRHNEIVSIGSLVANSLQRLFVSLKIGLISDVHATPAPVNEALTIFRREGITTILCAGDVAGYGKELEQTVELLIKSQCQVILGNHDLWQLSRSDDVANGPAEEYLRSLPAVMEFSVEGKKIYMVHASPSGYFMKGIKLLDENAELLRDQKNYWADDLKTFPVDILIVGHTHQVFAERLGHILVVNPGSTLFNHTCAILTLPEMTVQILSLSNKAPVLSWNWGMFYADLQ